MQPDNQRFPTPEPQYNKDGNFGYGILGFCIPIVGLVLFLVWKDEQPANAKYAGIGALISTILLPAIYILLIIIGVAASS